VVSDIGGWLVEDVVGRSKELSAIIARDGRACHGPAPVDGRYRSRRAASPIADRIIASMNWRDAESLGNWAS
jgi:hypothetical protein